MRSTESRILIWFNPIHNKIERTDIPYRLRENTERPLEKDGDHYYTVHYHKKTDLIHIIKHIKGHLTIYENKFCCTPPKDREDTIYLDCYGIGANIYGII